MIRPFRLAPCLAAVLMALAPFAASAAETAAPQSESQRLAVFFEQAYKQDLARSPETQSFRGIKDDYDKWDDLSDAFADEDIRIARARLKTLRKFRTAALTAAERLSRNIYELVLTREIENDRFRHHRYIMNQFRAPHTFVPSFLINIHQVTDKSDIEAYVSRLEKVGGLFDQVITQMRVREAKGIFPPRWSYPKMLEAARNVIAGVPFDADGADSTLFDDFKTKLAKLNLPEDEAGALTTRARIALTDTVKPAYERLIRELERQQKVATDDDGVWKLPDGKDYYANRLQFYTTTELTADQIHRMGLANVGRIHTQMREIMAATGFKGSLKEFFAFMREDPRFYYPDTDEGRARYLREATALIDAMRARLPDVFGILPKADIIVKRVEPFREKSAGKAFYQSPAPDGSRPGTYYANLFDMKQMPTYQMAALAYHEGIPGHHMQRAIAQELTGIPEFQKYTTFTAYTEGWGLYSEFLPKEMGFYADPHADFGRLAMELWRACRLVVDTGIHAKKWSREKAIAYLVENTPNSQGDAAKAIERYIVYPGQATAYLIGKQKILGLREAAKAKLGDRFDLRAFHDEVLKDGPVPLSILEQKVDAWVARTQAHASR